MAYLLESNRYGHNIVNGHGITAYVEKSKHREAKHITALLNREENFKELLRRTLNIIKPDKNDIKATQLHAEIIDHLEAYEDQLARKSDVKFTMKALSIGVAVLTLIFSLGI